MPETPEDNSKGTLIERVRQSIDDARRLRAELGKSLAERKRIQNETNEEWNALSKKK
jgi:hypothetical protein